MSLIICPIFHHTVYHVEALNLFKALVLGALTRKKNVPPTFSVYIVFFQKRYQLKKSENKNSPKTYDILIVSPINIPQNNPRISIKICVIIISQHGSQCYKLNIILDQQSWLSVVLQNIWT